MSVKLRPVIDVWPAEDRPEFAVRCDAVATIEQARREVARQYPNGLPVRYLGIRVVHLPEDEGRKGRRRRAYIFTDEPA